MGGKVLPYDAEIEYLENDKGDDSCVIDTGYVPNGADNDFFVDCMLLNYPVPSKQLIWLGAAKAGEFVEYSLFKPSNQDGFVKINNGSTTGVVMATVPFPYNERKKLSVYRNQTATIDGVSYNLNYLKPVNVNTDTVKIYHTYNYGYSAVFRIYSFKWVKGDKTVFDLIPVRKGDIGYMYDKVSGKLYGNSGTGKFILGPDKPKKPYDAEVEYLEINADSGLIDIDTGYIPTGLDNDIYMSFKHLGFQTGSNRSTYFHNGDANVEGKRYVMNQLQNRTNEIYVYNGSSVNMPGISYASVNISINNSYDIELHNASKSVVVNDKSYNANNNTIYPDKDNNLHIFGIWSEESHYNPLCQFYSFQWYKAGELVLDLIPVRKGNVGYMYDKVSGKLLGNVGDGEFTFGPDIN